MLRLVASLALVAAAVPVLACRGERLPPQPVLAAAQADVVVAGTVVEIADDVTMAKSHPDAVDEMAYTVATVRIESALLEAKNLTHVRVAVPMGSLDRAGAPFRQDGKFLFFLQRHPTTMLMLPSYAHPPVDLNRPGASDILRRVTVATAAMTDPVKALTAADPEDRTLAAIALAQRYRPRRMDTRRWTARPRKVGCCCSPPSPRPSGPAAAPRRPATFTVCCTAWGWSSRGSTSRG